MDYTYTVKTTAGIESVKLGQDVLAQCARKARREGMAAGITSGFLGGVLGRRVLRFDRSKTLLCGILTGILSGYFFTQAFLGTRIAEAVAWESHLRRRVASSELMPDETLQDPAAEERFAQSPSF